LILFYLYLFESSVNLFTLDYQIYCLCEWLALKYYATCYHFPYPTLRLPGK
jgi:hypothetical protein